MSLIKRNYKIGDIFSIKSTVGITLWKSPKVDDLEIICLLYSDDICLIIDEKIQWFKIFVNGKIGWFHVSSSIDYTINFTKLLSD